MKPSTPVPVSNEQQPENQCNRQTEGESRWKRLENDQPKRYFGPTFF
jgi:hypothetical protein